MAPCHRSCYKAGSQPRFLFPMLAPPSCLPRPQLLVPRRCSSACSPRLRFCCRPVWPSHLVQLPHSLPSWSRAAFSETGGHLAMCENLTVITGSGRNLGCCETSYNAWERPQTERRVIWFGRQLPGSNCCWETLISTLPLMRFLQSSLYCLKNKHMTTIIF